MKRLVALVTLFSFVLFAPGWAQGLPTAKPEQVGLSSERLERVSRALRSEIEAGKIPGAVALVARKGQIVYFESFGVRDTATGEAMPKDAIFRLYSMTKPFASVAAMMLMEDGKLLLTDPVSKFLPQLAKREVSVAAARSAPPARSPTRGAGRARDDRPGPPPAHLGSRLRSFTPNPRVKELYEKNGVDWADVTPEEQIERLAKVPLAHQPGTTWEYSLSTDVLGPRGREVSGATLGPFFDERVFGPLKMTDTRFVVPRPSSAASPSRSPSSRARGSRSSCSTSRWPPKNDAGGAGSAATRRTTRVPPDAAQRRPARRHAPAESDHRRLHDRGSSRRHEDRPARRRRHGYGFGLGFAVRTDAGHRRGLGSVGEYRWGGAAGTAFWVDPKEEMITVLMPRARRVPRAATPARCSARWCARRSSSSGGRRGGPGVSCLARRRLRSRRDGRRDRVLPGASWRRGHRGRALGRGLRRLRQVRRLSGARLV